ncbi:patatin-like phospholipase family protein [Amphiplicatus metriothermophilus]|uniref:NTE family protein n=1 Tax=Amphiplicatus metriothermophilus TaxID=1519374 RepID=A0A239PT75_9PROT|nr:patatin-like phospholipase family protein [Amphiplicatus metriothermophilus]MBB5519291.1 NTE family protein [Amphiplicatus metriothermophilus]SNT73360.1 NTE family protein [Amphiplicatus metriothermophilus]
MAEDPAKPVNLALQGGGAHGAIAWGVLDRLLEDGRLEIDSISGSSAGAVNAVALAYGYHRGGRDGARETLGALWRAISDKGRVFSPVRRTPWETATGAYNLDNSLSYRLFDIFTRIFSPYQFNPFGFNPLKDVLAETIDFESLRECRRAKLFLAATNVRTGKIRIFRTEEISLDVVLASACLPFLFKAVEIDGEHYWDGGYMGNPALFPFFYEAGTSDIIIVHVNPLEREGPPMTAPEILNRINEISFNSSLLRELRAINFVHRLLDDGWIKDEYRDRLRDIRIHSVRCDRSVSDLSVASKFNVEWAFLTELKERGRRIAEAWLEENFDLVGARSSVDIRAMFDGGPSAR